MKTIILGDIHGRTIWKDILDREQPDRLIFLGDYVSSHENISEEDQVNNLKKILDYKEANCDKVVMLRGNHDMEALGYHWAECRPSFINKSTFWDNSAELKNRFLSNTQWIYVEGTVFYSHAGISQKWFTNLKSKYPEIIKDVADINLIDPDKEFGFIAGPDNPFDGYGDSIYQPCTWIRPTALLESAIAGTHIVGHTTVSNTVVHLSDVMQKKENENVVNDDIWFCDTLGNGSYLVQIDGEFIVKQI